MDKILVQGQYNQAEIFSELRDEKAIQQIREMCNDPLYKDGVIKVMPDYHPGAGCTIGLTMKLPRNAIVNPNFVGVDISCFSADTKVKLTDGRDLSFEELINDDKEHYGYSLDDKGHVCVSKLEYPRKIKTVDKTLIITLDNNEKIRCTLDHIFYKRNLEEVQAKDLKIGDSLYPLYIKKRNELSVDEKFISDDNRLVNNTDDHLCIYDAVFNGYKYIHHLSDDYNYRHNIDTKDGSFVRHHIDFDKYNNDPTNIKRVNFEEHWKIHADNFTELNKKGIVGYNKLVKKYGEEKAEEFCSKAGKKGSYKTWHSENSDELRKKVSENLRKYTTSDIAREKARLRQLTNNTTKFSEQNKQEWFINRQKIGHLRKVFIYMVEHNLEFNEENYNNSRFVVYHAFTYKKALGIMNETKLSFNDIAEGKTVKNHRIINIEIINEPIDVYCLTCQEFGNFALSSGVFVHNCGLLAIKLSKKPNLQDLDDICHRNVPSGFYGHKEPVSEKAQEYIDALYKKLNDPYKLARQLGSLGSGNHFIELDQSGNEYYLVIHSGSRNAGLQVATEYFKDFENHNLNMENYLHDILIMGDYAHDNRMLMAEIIMKRLKLEPVEIIESVHNYIEVNNDSIIIRKGAISAKQNEKCIIPLNMRDGTIIGVGKSNEDWNCSAPHGAGRVLSRSEAKSKISLDKFEQSMKGIYSTTICKGTLDEAPMAYKPKKYILDQIGQTVDIIDVMKPIYNFKAVTEKRRK